MNNYGIRYESYGHAWIPDGVELNKYMSKDQCSGCYGSNTHQFVPKEYAVEKE